MCFVWGLAISDHRPCPSPLSLAHLRLFHSDHLSESLCRCFRWKGNTNDRVTDPIQSFLFSHWPSSAIASPMAPMAVLSALRPGKSAGPSKNWSDQFWSPPNDHFLPDHFLLPFPRSLFPFPLHIVPPPFCCWTSSSPPSPFPSAVAAIGADAVSAKSTNTTSSVPSSCPSIRVGSIAIFALNFWFWEGIDQIWSAIDGVTMMWVISRGGGLGSLLFYSSLSLPNPFAHRSVVWSRDICSAHRSLASSLPRPFFPPINWSVAPYSAAMMALRPSVLTRDLPSVKQLSPPPRHQKNIQNYEIIRIQLQSTKSDWSKKGKKLSFYKQQLAKTIKCSANFHHRVNSPLVWACTPSQWLPCTVSSAPTTSRWPPLLHPIKAIYFYYNSDIPPPFSIQILGPPSSICALRPLGILSSPPIPPPVLRQPTEELWSPPKHCLSAQFSICCWVDSAKSK